MTSSLILDKAQTLRKIKRMAFEVYENNAQEEEIIFIGIHEMGYLLAQRLQKEFNQIASIPSQLVKLTLDKQAPVQSDIQLDCTLTTLQNKAIILVDDVLNTGRTLIYSLRPFFEIPVKKFQTALLVNRNYRRFPIAADYVGYTLATTLQEHITVVLDDEEALGVYLS
ncbi:MAG: phosphoribosyltransferase family protein [Thermonemataceae bacterium]